MAGGQVLLKLPALLLSLLLSFITPITSSLPVVSLHKNLPGAAEVAVGGVFPPTCDRIECPKFDVVQLGNGFDIRRYNSAEWMSSSAIEDISLVDATRAGFLQLFDYIQGKNEYKVKIEMTAPVITEVSPSDGPFCASSFVVSFYVPEKNQENPPPAEGLHVQKWGLKYVAVRQFGGFVSDSDVGKEAAALHDSLVASGWADAMDRGQVTGEASVYIVVQYNSPFEFDNRVNEIWIMLDVAKVHALAQIA